MQVGNLDFLLTAMEAIAREHAITAGFLRQVILDIQRNDIANVIRLSRFDALSAKFGTILPNSIPMLARSHVSRHSECAPPLPGRLPLGKPVGRVSSRNMCNDDDDNDVPVSHGFVPVADSSPDDGVGCQVRGNRPMGTGTKRRRMSPSSMPSNSEYKRTPATSATQSWNTSNESRNSGRVSPVENYIASNVQLPGYYSTPDRPDFAPLPQPQRSTTEKTRLPHRVSSPFDGPYSDPNAAQRGNMPTARPATTSAPPAMPPSSGATTVLSEDMHRDTQPAAVYNGTSHSMPQHMAGTLARDGGQGWTMHQNVYTPAQFDHGNSVLTTADSFNLGDRKSVV